MDLQPQIDELKYQMANHQHLNIDGTKILTLKSIQESVPTITTGILPPTTTPKKIGDIFVNTALAKVYISTGTASSVDWSILN